MRHQYSNVILVISRKFHSKWELSPLGTFFLKKEGFNGIESTLEQLEDNSKTHTTHGDRPF
jgi:hypothetical protein